MTGVLARMARTCPGASLALALAFSSSTAAPAHRPAAANLYGSQAYSAAVAQPAPTVAAAPEAPRAPTQAELDKFKGLQRELKSQGPASQAAPSRGLFAMTLQLLFGLCGVLLLAVFLLRGAKRLQSRWTKASPRSGDFFEVLETCHLGPQQKVVAVRMRDELCVLGLGPQGVTLLRGYGEGSYEPERQRRAAESNVTAFSDTLGRALERFKQPKRVGEFFKEE